MCSFRLTLREYKYKNTKPAFKYVCAGFIQERERIAYANHSQHGNCELFKRHNHTEDENLLEKDN